MFSAVLGGSRSATGYRRKRAHGFDYRQVRLTDDLSDISPRTKSWKTLYVTNINIKKKKHSFSFCSSGVLRKKKLLVTIGFKIIKSTDDQ